MLQLLKQAYKTFPLEDTTAQHNLIYSEDLECFVLNILYKGHWFDFTLEPEDKDRNPSDVLEEVKKVIDDNYKE